MALLATTFAVTGGRAQAECTFDDDEPPLLHHFTPGPAVDPPGTLVQIVADDSETGCNGIIRVLLDIDNASFVTDLNPVDRRWGDPIEEVRTVLGPGDVSPGTHLFRFYAYDQLGNAGICEEVVYTLAPGVAGTCENAPPGLCAPVRRSPGAGGCVAGSGTGPGLPV